MSGEREEKKYLSDKKMPSRKIRELLRLVKEANENRRDIKIGTGKHLRLLQAPTNCRGKLFTKQSIRNRVEPKWNCTGLTK